MWNKIYISEEDVITKTEKSVLIRLPEDFKVWVSNKLIYEIINLPEGLTISYQDGFTFTKFKQELTEKDGKRIYETVEEIELSGEELTKLLNNESIERKAKKLYEDYLATKN